MAVSVSFVHTSPAAIGPLMQYYGENAPEFEITNQLDDGLLRMLSRGDRKLAEQRLEEMIRTSRDVYGARAALVTCSSVTGEMIRNLGSAAGIPLIKIDEPMADEAVAACTRIGILMSFRPTQEPTTRLLNEAAERAGKTVELVPALRTDAYDALLSGHPERHDALLLEVASDLVSQDVDGIVLAQVSMARLLPKLRHSVPVPVFSSLPSSLSRMREVLS